MYQWHLVLTVGGAPLPSFTKAEAAVLSSAGAAAVPLPATAATGNAVD
jgi:hypothetical protein